MWPSGEHYHTHPGLARRDREETDESLDEIENMYEISFASVLYASRTVHQESKIDFQATY